MFARQMRAAFHAIREAITPTLTLSQLGKLTPEEFVIAGSSLVRAYPSFSWTSDGANKSYLPPERQYLVMRNVACRSRASDSKGEFTESAEGEWNAVAPNSTETYDDLDNYSDPAINEVAASDAGVDRAVSAVRLYDMYLVYDTYYACPRVYLVGRHFNGHPLAPDEMMQDVYQDYAEKTATLERHPFFPDLLTISVHPCRHVQTMKRIMEQMNITSIENYMPAFLKMMASMLPTMEYDYTNSI